jgi:serine/threonine protein kinase
MQYCSHCHKTFSAQTQFCPEDGSRLETRTEFDVGMVVRDKYQILEVLGEGGMGRVYKVKDLYFKYGRNLGAMKVPSAELAANPSYLERFIDEAAKARALDHPNIVRIENVDKTDNGVPFLVMELVEGTPLRTWMERQQRFEWRQAAAIAREIALALAAAHKVGIIHCDIKPENILSVNRDAPVPLKVADFGLAKATEALHNRMTRVRSTTWSATSTPGTLDYMSPEQTVARGLVGQPSDIYSLGIILYELLSGTTPFGHIADEDQVKRHHREEPPPSLSVLPDVPQALILLVQSMLEKSPDWRPYGAEVAAKIDTILQSPAETEQRSATHRVTEVETPQPVRRPTVVETERSPQPVRTSEKPSPAPTGQTKKQAASPTRNTQTRSHSAASVPVRKPVATQRDLSWQSVLIVVPTVVLVVFTMPFSLLFLGSQQHSAWVPSVGAAVWLAVTFFAWLFDLGTTKAAWLLGASVPCLFGIADWSRSNSVAACAAVGVSLLAAAYAGVRVSPQEGGRDTPLSASEVAACLGVAVFCSNPVVLLRMDAWSKDILGAGHSFRWVALAAAVVSCASMADNAQSKWIATNPKKEPGKLSPRLSGWVGMGIISWFPSLLIGLIGYAGHESGRVATALGIAASVGVFLHHFLAKKPVRRWLSSEAAVFVSTVAAVVTAAAINMIYHVTVAPRP